MRSFQREVLGYYRRNCRDLPWRKTRDPYCIVVSEIMLQQTQVPRVIAKYDGFIRKFPTTESLARAPLRSILAAWQGLGYNRRALFLQKFARQVLERFKGTIPDQRRLLSTVPGIGDATAGSICAFAFGQPVVFIETNIRSVFIHHFFKDKEGVSDRELLPLVEEALYRKDPRTWYSALMDYGVHLKATRANPSRKSSHYVRQSRFQGSDRQIRGRILALLVKRPLAPAALFDAVAADRRRIQKLINVLLEEGFLTRRNGLLGIAR
ncbi:MAG: A/G-specific adenine glycosylase [Candidatus Omnitrophica bacterium]|nr:A/G-specific adenine glycosylase [Candidatus Omnitrophota bacterium]